MSKTIIRNIVEHNLFKQNHTNKDRSKGPFTDVHIGGPPESYPAVLVYELQYNSEGPDTYEGEYVYLRDFEGT